MRLLQWASFWHLRRALLCRAHERSLERRSRHITLLTRVQHTRQQHARVLQDRFLVECRVRGYSCTGISWAGRLSLLCNIHPYCLQRAVLAQQAL